MAVTAQFVPDLIDVLPNVSSTLTLRLYSDDEETRQVTLIASGDLRDHARIDAETATIETNQIVDIPVTVFVPSTVEAGTYTLAAEVRVVVMPPTLELTIPPLQSVPADDDSAAATSAERHEPADARAEVSEIAGLIEATDTAAAAEAAVVVATATVVVAAHSDYTIALLPAQSRGSSVGRHMIRVANTGNVTLELGVSAVQMGGDITIAPDTALLTVPPGAATDTPLLVTPNVRYWNGPPRDHGFVLHATTADGRANELVGTYEQRPRVPNWVGPAAAGALAALLIGAIAWFALLRPWVEDTADEAAAEAIEEDRAALRERIDELEAAAAEAEELPLGSPTDIRLDVEPTGGNTEQVTASADPGTVVSVTDVVFQNPTGAVGTMTLRRGDDVILRSELANFRDFDLHFVAPYVFTDDDELVFEVECLTPGAGESTCPVGVSLVGFVDETD